MEAYLFLLVCLTGALASTQPFITPCGDETEMSEVLLVEMDPCVETAGRCGVRAGENATVSFSFQPKKSLRSLIFSIKGRMDLLGIEPWVPHISNVDGCNQLVDASCPLKRNKKNRKRKYTYHFSYTMGISHMWKVVSKVKARVILKGSNRRHGEFTVVCQDIPLKVL